MFHVKNNTGENEWYTPPAIIEAVVKVLGTIELDPASCDQAQLIVNADTYFTKANDGLARKWQGKVFLNPPYAKEIIVPFIDKLLGHYQRGDVSAAIVLTNNSTETKWFQTLSKTASAICFPAKRIKFLSPKGKTGTPLQGQAIVYLGSHPETFRQHFAQFGYTT